MAPSPNKNRRLLSPSPSSASLRTPTACKHRGQVQVSTPLRDAHHRIQGIRGAPWEKPLLACLHPRTQTSWLQTRCPGPTPQFHLKHARTQVEAHNTSVKHHTARTTAVHRGAGIFGAGRAPVPPTSFGSKLCMSESGRSSELTPLVSTAKRRANEYSFKVLLIGDAGARRYRDLLCCPGALGNFRNFT